VNGSFCTGAPLVCDDVWDGYVETCCK